MECSSVEETNALVQTILDLSSGRLTASDCGALERGGGKESTDADVQKVDAGMALENAMWAGYVLS
jgi:hypothetical protein